MIPIENRLQIRMLTALSVDSAKRTPYERYTLNSQLWLSVVGGFLHAAACGFRLFYENVLVAAPPPPPPPVSSVSLWWREVARALGIGA